MGPLATGDLAGLDVGWRIRKEYRHLEKPGVRQPFAEDQLCELGRFGQKTGAGWYKYDENRKAAPDPEVDGARRKWVAEAGIAQRQISAEEIVDRCSTLWSTKARAFWKKASLCAPSDIDIIYLNGYGFPAYRGGPMWYADTVGLKNVYDRIYEFHRTRRTLGTCSFAEAAGRTRQNLRRFRQTRIRRPLVNFRGGHLTPLCRRSCR